MALRLETIWPNVRTDFRPSLFSLCHMEASLDATVRSLESFTQFFLFSLCWTCHYLLCNLYLSLPIPRPIRLNSQRTNILIHEWTVIRAWNFGTECFWVKTSSQRSQLLTRKTTKIWRPSVNFLGKHIMNVLQLYATSSVTIW